MKWNSILEERYRDWYDDYGHKSMEREEKISEVLNEFEFPKEKPYYRNITGLRAPNIKYYYTKKEKLLIKDIKNDPKSMISIIDEFILRDYQQEIIDNLQKNRFNIFNTSRQIGMSSTIILHLLHYLTTNDDKTAIIILPNQISIKEFYDKFFDFYLSLPYYMRRGVKSLEKNKNIVFDNGSRVFFSTTSDRAIGLSIDYLVLTDFAYHTDRNAKKILSTLLPVSIARNGRVSIYSSPNKSDDEFAKLYLSNNVFSKHEYPWDVISGRDEDWVKDMVNSIGGLESFIKEFECSFPGTKQFYRSYNLRQLLGK